MNLDSTHRFVIHPVEKRDPVTLPHCLSRESGNTSKPTSPHLSSPKYDSWILSHSIPMQIGIQPQPPCHSRPDREYIKPTSPYLSSPKYDPWILSHSIPMQIGIQPRTHCRSRPDREYIKTNLASLIIPEIRSMDSLPLHPDANRDPVAALIVFLESAFGGRNTCNLCFGVCLFITKTNKPAGVSHPHRFHFTLQNLINLWRR